MAERLSKIREVLAAKEKEALDLIKGDLSQWLTTILKDVVVTPSTFMKTLETGVVLCKLVEMVQLLALKRKSEGNLGNFKFKVPMEPLSCSSSAGPGTLGAFHSRVNTSNFISWCRKLGVDESVVFESEGLVLHKDEKRVILCLLDVARYAARVGVLPPQLVSMEREIDMLEGVADELSEVCEPGSKKLCESCEPGSKELTKSCEPGSKELTESCEPGSKELHESIAGTDALVETSEPMGNSTELCDPHNGITSPLSMNSAIPIGDDEAEDTEVASPPLPVTSKQFASRIPVKKSTKSTTKHRKSLSISGTIAERGDTRQKYRVKRRATDVGKAKDKDGRGINRFNEGVEGVEQIKDKRTVEERVMRRVEECTCKNKIEVTSLGNGKFSVKGASGRIMTVYARVSL